MDVIDFLTVFGYTITEKKVTTAKSLENFSGCCFK